MELLVPWVVLCAGGLVLGGGAEAQQGDACAEAALLQVPGDATLSGLFNVHGGQNCSDGNSTGLQQMAAAAWIVNTLNQNNFLPGIKIGIDLYDACTTDADIIFATLQRHGECQRNHHLGLITTPELNESLHLDTEANDTSVFLTDSYSTKELLTDITINILVSLNWSNIDYLLAPTEDIIVNFNEKSFDNRICIVKEFLMPDFKSPHWKHLLQKAVRLEGNNSQVILLFGSWTQIISVAETIYVTNMSSVQWIFVPFDDITHRSHIEGAPDNSLVVLPTIGILQKKQMHNNMNFSHDQQLMLNATSLHPGRRISINYSVFMNIALPVLRLITKFRNALQEYCTTDSPEYICTAFLSSHDSSSNQLSEAPKEDAIMRMIMKSKYVIVTAASQKGQNNILEDFAIYELYPENELPSLKIISKGYYEIFKEDFCSVVRNNTTSLRTCSHCSNFRGHSSTEDSKLVPFNEIHKEIAWRTEAWVAALSSIAAVGVVCALSIMIFISVRICKGDILEGNPLFSFLLLFSIIFTYTATLPFSVTYEGHNEHLSNLFCVLRITGTTLSYAFLFSIMLSRSLMLVSFDSEGPFMSHINGFMQTVLCIFILGVQIALGIQFIIIRTNFLNAETCRSMYEGYNFHVLLCYDIFLLVLLVCSSPFTFHTKRNYSEGMFFTIASIVCLLVWVSWSAAYFFLPRDWEDIAVSGGLTATATGILVCIFIPRTYLMMTAIVRDNLASALPSLACTNSNSILDINYRTTSQQILYDCVNPYPCGQLNPNFYSEQPHGITSIKSEVIEPATSDCTYEMCDSPTTPNKVTHF